MTTISGCSFLVRARHTPSQNTAGRLPARMSGFTLFEYLVTLIVAGIAMANSAPSFVQLVDSNRLSSQTNALVGTVRLARSEAVRRGEQVTLCPANESATDCGDGSNAWKNGWLVRTNDGLVLREVPALEGGNVLSGSTNLATGVAFNAMGEPSASGHFLLCEGLRQGQAREVDINEIGRIRVIRHSGGNSSCTAAA